MASKCSYRDCDKQREEGRMFCSEHVGGHGVSEVVSFRGSRDDSSGGSALPGCPPTALAVPPPPKVDDKK